MLLGKFQLYSYIQKKRNGKGRLARSVRKTVSSISEEDLIKANLSNCSEIRCFYSSKLKSVRLEQQHHCSRVEQ